MKYMNQVRNFGLLSLVGALGTAHAAIPAGVEAAFTEAGADGATVIGYATLASVAMIAALWVKRAINK